MKATVRDFQLYLLSKMTADELVDKALHSLSATRADMKQAAAAIAASHGLDEVVHRAAAYRELIGAPESERTLRATETTESFVGSVRRSYRLPLWPKVEFVVNEHPEGWAWGEQFEQPEGARMPSDPQLIAPWDWTKALLTAKAKAVETLDEWSDYFEGRFSFAKPDGTTESYVARFDLGLLQSWTREP